MLKRFSKRSKSWSLVAIAFMACAAEVQAQAGKPVYLSAGTGQPVCSPYGDCWRTGEWTEEVQVLFDFERAELDAQARKALDDLAQGLLAMELHSVAGNAYADRIGADGYNTRLSARRAEAIRVYLVEKGVPDRLLRFDNKGARDPVTAGHCDAMGPESRRNEKLIACLRPDRRVAIQVNRFHKVW
jgi:outer membrane protein OmpA-like peptidoglycan-associated protein